MHLPELQPVDEHPEPRQDQAGKGRVDLEAEHGVDAGEEERGLGSAGRIAAELEAVQAGQFWVFTHPESLELIEARHEELLQGYAFLAEADARRT